MPVAELYVEGSLDIMLLNAVLGCVPMKRNWTVKLGGSKGSLGPQARKARDEGKDAYYIRDRDFDFEPPAAMDAPFVVESDGKRKTVLGWAWVRHEIENYLLDPLLAARALGWEASAFALEISAAARAIRHYQVARWVVGLSRRNLPPYHVLNTRPIDFEGNEFKLPSELDESSTREWCRSHIAKFADGLQKTLCDAAICTGLSGMSAKLSDGSLAASGGALSWCSGKDLLAALDHAIRARSVDGPKAYRTTVALWAEHHPVEFLASMPEWAAFLKVLDTC